MNGCAVLFRASLFQHVGMLSEKFFSEKRTLSFRGGLRKRKYRWHVCYEAIVYHKVSSSTKSSISG